MRKRFLKNFLPDFYFPKITDIKADFFSGSRLILLDVDNTLVFSETTETKKEIIGWFYGINNIYKCNLISNSKTIKKRSGAISKLLDCQIFLSPYKKPFKKLFLDLEKKYNFGNGKVFVVGDRIFTDILFGNLNGATTVLVVPLGGKENMLIKIVRKIENFTLFLVGFLGYN